MNRGYRIKWDETAQPYYTQSGYAATGMYYPKSSRSGNGTDRLDSHPSLTKPGAPTTTASTSRTPISFTKPSLFYSSQKTLSKSSEQLTGIKLRELRQRNEEDALTKLYKDIQ